MIRMMFDDMRSNSRQRLKTKHYFAAYLSVSYDIVSAAPPLSEPAVDNADLVRVRLPGEVTDEAAAEAAAAVGVDAAAGARVSGLALAAAGSQTAVTADTATAVAAAGAFSTSST
jgi:hypothetical protein